MDRTVDRIEELEGEVRALKASLSGLQEEVAELRREQSSRRHPVEALLWQRGLPVLAHGDRTQVLLPAAASPAQADRFYQLMRRYSFRLFLRELLQASQGEDVRALGRYCSARTVKSYLADLAEARVVQLGPGRSYSLIPKHITSLGLTLEWYVSEILRREFLAPVLFNVRLQNTQYGGDYDVVATIAGHPVYVEVKSSPPRGVELPAVSAFLNRLQDLQPHVAIFLVDTELRMRDKIVPLFAEALELQGTDPKQWPVVRLAGEIFQIRHRIYLANSRKGIYSNLRLCFRDFLRRENSSGSLPAPGGTSVLLSNQERGGE